MKDILVLGACLVLTLVIIAPFCIAQPLDDTVTAPKARPCGVCCPNWGAPSNESTTGCPNLVKEQFHWINFYTPEITEKTSGRGLCDGSLQCWPLFHQPVFQEAGGANATYYYRWWVANVEERTVIFPPDEEKTCTVTGTITYRYPLSGPGTCLQPSPSPSPGGSGGGGIECLGSGESCIDTTQCCDGLVCGDGFCGDIEVGPGCPVLIDVLGDGFSLTNALDGVNFDLRPDRVKERISWTAAQTDDAWLVLDRNGNGTVDDGSELFGNYTPQTEVSGVEKNGFAALAEFDKPDNGGNNDRVITTADAVFVSLRLWQDVNHNGISEASELHPLYAYSLAVIELEYKLSKKVDQYGNQFRYRAKVRDSKDGRIGRWAWDMFLLAP